MQNLHPQGQKSWLPAKENSSLPISTPEGGTKKSAAEYKGWTFLKVTHRFPLSPWKWGGGGWDTQNDRRISEGAASVREPEEYTFNGSP